MDINILNQIDGLEVSEEFADERLKTKKLYYYQGKKATLRHFENKTRQKFQNMVETLQALNKLKFSCAPILYFKDDNKMISIEEYIEGKPSGKMFYFDRDFYDNMPAADFFECIRNLKSFEIKLAIDIDARKKFYSEKVDRIKKYWPRDLSGVAKWADRLNKVVSSPLTYRYLCHGDLNPGNIIMLNQSLRGFIDWELACLDSRAREFAYLYYLSLDEKDWAEKFKQKFEKTYPEDMPEFEIFLIFSLLGDMATFSNMIEIDKYSHDRSGQMTYEELTRLLNRNIELASHLLT